MEKNENFGDIYKNFLEILRRVDNQALLNGFRS